MRRESAVRLPWFAALTTPPLATSNWPAAVTLDDASDMERRPVEPIALPSTVMLLAEAVPALFTIIVESVGKTAPKPIRKLPPAPVAAMLPPCSTVTVELAISPSSSAVFVKIQHAAGAGDIERGGPRRQSQENRRVMAFQVEPP